MFVSETCSRDVWIDLVPMIAQDRAFQKPVSWKLGVDHLSRLSGMHRMLQVIERDEEGEASSTAS